MLSASLASRAEADHLLIAHMDAATAKLLDDRLRRGLVDAKEIHRELDTAARELEHQSLHTANAARGLTQGSRHASGFTDRRVREQDVEGDQRLARADAHGPGGGVEVGSAEVWLGASRANVRERPLLAVSIEEDGDVEAGPDAPADLVRNIATRVDGGRAHRHDRHHVCGANAWMDAGMLAQVDALRCGGDRPEKGLDQPLAQRQQRHDDAVVVGIGVDVEHVRRFGGGGDGIDHRAVLALGEIGYRFEQLDRFHGVPANSRRRGAEFAGCFAGCFHALLG